MDVIDIVFRLIGAFYAFGGLAAIRAAVPGKPWNRIHDVALREITRGLRDLGLLKGDLRKLVDRGACRKWFMHGTSHWLGMDLQSPEILARRWGRRLLWGNGSLVLLALLFNLLVF